MSDKILKARQMMTHHRRVIDVVVGGNMVQTAVTRTGVGRIETKVGDFWAFSFAVDDLWQEYHALVVTELNDQLHPTFDKTRPIPVRLAMSRINRASQGVIITIPTQDGRGKGLAFKLATLFLQQHGMDTYEAAHALIGVGSMALGKCPECVGIVSTTAKACPHCGSTAFLVRTGRRVLGRCRYCDGSGKNELYDGSLGGVCVGCNGTGQVPAR